MPHVYAYEQMKPRDLAAVLTTAPVAYVPLGTLEFHGWHLPFGFDALKAHAICQRIAARTGGVVLPPTYAGFAGGHVAFEGSIMVPGDVFQGHVATTLDRLATMGFRVIVALTGHYPQEQIDAVHVLAEQAMQAHPGLVVIGLCEPEAYAPEWRGDHAGQWETSIALYLMPEQVDLAGMADYAEPLHGIHGGDPRTGASAERGRETVEGIVGTLVERVRKALGTT